MSGDLKNERDLEDEAAKYTILSKHTTFKGAFMATLGFYVAQTLVTFVGILTFLVIGVVLYKLS